MNHTRINFTASKHTGFNKTGIGKVSRRERKSCGGYYWNYA
jgi:hypothetical protein